MSNVPVASNNEVAIPQNLAAMFGTVESNISSFQKANQLRTAGKVWRMQVDGELKTLTTEVEGEQVPVPMVKAIILSQNPDRSRASFDGGFEEGSAQAPVCWSNDGKHPDSRVTEPTSAQCQGCPSTIKGSAFTDKGEPTTACKQHKDIVVIVNSALFPELPALKLRLSTTSLWESNDKAKPKEVQGWYAYDAYCKFLSSKGIPHTAAVETTMKFDTEVNYPKVLFKYAGPISEKIAAMVIPRLNSEEVLSLAGIAKKESHPNIPVPQPKSEAIQESDPFSQGETEVKAETPSKTPRKPREQKAVEQPKSVEVQQEVSQGGVVAETSDEFMEHLDKMFSFDD